MASDGDVSTFQANFQRSNSAETNGSVNYVKDRSAPSALTPKSIEIADCQFHNFDAWRSREKFQPGQIWAFYSEEDGLPRYYGQITAIGTSPDLELHIVWLGSCWLPQNTIKWEDKNMLISCGRFRTKTGNSNVYNNTDSVSHKVRVNFDAAGGEYSIFPRKGEVWALYRKWTPKLKCSDLINWEYDIVEVIEENAFWLEVLVLEFVRGYNSVFKHKTQGGSIVTRKIQQSQLLTFSHQIPAFKLTDEEHGRLRGFWELDPGALPTYFWTSK